MEAFILRIISIFYHRPPTMEQQVIQGLTALAGALAVLREVPRDDPRGDEFPPVFDDDASQSLIMCTTANGALYLRVRDDDKLAPELLEQAVAAADSITTAHALNARARAAETNSRAIYNVVVPVIAIAAVAFVALRPRR
ncbi:hypothetical protein OQA88_7690 [Cercophora sp. LCS_1]